MRHVFETALALLKIRVFHKRIPLFVSWNITFRCNLHCLYCGSCDAPQAELDTQEVLDGLEILWGLGTRWITFGGGEPLLRKDLGDIVRRSKEIGFRTYLSTNGWRVADKTEELKHVDHVNLSLDGTREAHDRVRGAGAYDKAMEALKTCKAIGVPVSLQFVLNRYNLDAVDHAVATASEYNVPIMFQPATKWLSTSLKENPIAPDTQSYRKAVARIADLKRQGAPVRNSHAGLRHLACWPEPRSLFCVAGRAMAILEPDGSMLACHQCQVGQFLEGADKTGDMAEKFRELRLPKQCAQCWCAPVVELCLFFSLHPEAMCNAFKYG